MSKRKCKNDPNNFCYICGKFTPQDLRATITERLKHAYKLYFGIKLGDLDKSWAPHVSCSSCYTALTQWMNGKKKKMAFCVPMVWREQKDHFTDCYFCMTKISRFSKKTRSQIKYPDCLSAIKSVPHSLEYPVPQPPSEVALDLESECSTDAATSSASESDFHFEEPTEEITEVPHLISQGELQDLARDLCLSKEKSELLGSRLKQWNLLQKGANTTIFRKRHLVLAPYFCLEDDICFCKDISSLMLSLDEEYKADEWRLFIDSNKTSLKAVLLHNGNQKPSVPVAHSRNTTESYHAMKKLLMCIRYNDHKWHICGDLKVVGLLLGLQLGYT